MAGRGRGRGIIPTSVAGDAKACYNLSIDDLIKMGKGKGSGGKGPREKSKINFNQALSMSLEDVIQSQRNSSQTKPQYNCTKQLERSQVESMALDEIIQPRRKVGERKQVERSSDSVDCARAHDPHVYAVDVNGTLGALTTRGQVREYKEDALKSLDDVVEERGILKPPRYGGGSRKDDNDLPITGKPKIWRNRDRPRASAQLDPMSSSLEAIIVDRKIDDSSGGFPKHSKKRQRNADEMDGSIDDQDLGKQRRSNFTPKFVPGPYRAVSYLQEAGMIVDLKIGLKVAATEEDKEPIRKWRCIVKCGAVQGVADCARKAVAREMACDSFMKNLKDLYPDGKIPHYEVPGELFLDPHVYDAIKKLGEEAGSSMSFDISFGNTEAGGGRNEFTCVYYVDDKEIADHSCEQNYAQLKAAYKVYELLKGEPFPKSVFFANAECDLNVEYDFIESEIYQVASRDEQSTAKVDFPNRKLQAIEMDEADASLELQARHELSEKLESEKKKDSVTVSLQRTIKLEPNLTAIQIIRPATILGNENVTKSVPKDFTESPLTSVGRGRGRGRGLTIRSMN